MANFANSSVKPLTVLTEDDGVPGSKIEQDPENYTVEQLKRWLKCRGLKQSGKRGEIVQRVSDCLKGPNHRLPVRIQENGKSASHFYNIPSLPLQDHTYILCSCWA